MASDTIFSSSSESSQQRWINQIHKTMESRQVPIFIDHSLSIFRVPQPLRRHKPKSYAPQQLGLGPYHHFHPRLYKMEWTKIAVAKQNVNNQIQLLLDTLKELEPNIRACYDHYLDLDGDAIAWIITIDGIFLLREVCDIYTEHVQDIMMLENQIPLFTLLEIAKSLQLSFPYANWRNFCETNSPLKLKVQPEGFQLNASGYSHLLDYMYKNVVKNEAADHGFLRMQENFFKDARKILNVAGKLVGLAGAPQIQSLLKFIEMLPCEKFVSSLCGKKDQSDSVDDSDDTATAGKGIGIPSVSKLHHVAQVKFCVTPLGGIREIKFNKEELTFSLPAINLNIHSEVILRNLVAYEVSLSTTPGSTSSLELAEYVELMNGIIKTEKDVKLLREKDIMTGDLGDDDIVKMFEGMQQCILKGKKESKLGKVIEEVNEEYDGTPVVKANRIMVWCGSVSWTFLSGLITIVLLCVMILQSYCQIYSCSNPFSRKVVMITSM